MSGRPRDVEDKEILWEMFRRSDPGFVASEVAEFVDMSRQGIHNRLVELEDMGLVSSKNPGRDRVWWLLPAGEDLAEEYGDQSTQ